MLSTNDRRDLFLRFWTGIHEAIFKATGGRILRSVVGMPVVMLTTIGRKSGQPRTTMLTAPIVEGDSYVLVASKGGDDRHPLWFLNLRANPKVEATVDGKKRAMTARVASPEEKQRLWPQVTAKYGGYAGYQKKTDRDIPLVILEPEV